MFKIIFIISLMLLAINLIAAEYGGIVIDEQVEHRTVIENGKAFTYASVYQGECFTLYYEDKERSIGPGSFVNAVMNGLGINSIGTVVDRRSCYLSLQVRINFTEPCLVDARDLPDLPISSNLSFTCEKKFKAGYLQQVSETIGFKHNCESEMSRITGFRSDREDLCKKEILKYINYYANQMLLIEAN